MGRMSVRVHANGSFEVRWHADASDRTKRFAERQEAEAFDHLVNGAPGRPRIGARIEVRFPSETLEQLDRRAAAERISRPELIRRIVEVALPSFDPNAESAK
jgi:Ribbon-helix-helix protein, copG family